MKLKEIKSVINNMAENQMIDFFSLENQSSRTDRITKKSDNEYEIYSWGQGWCDQIAELFDKKTTIKALWDQKPHAYIM